MPYHTAFPAEPGWFSVELYVKNVDTGVLTRFSEWIDRWGGVGLSLAKPASVVIHHFPIVGWAWEEGEEGEASVAVPIHEQPDVDEDGRVAPGGVVCLRYPGPLHERYDSVAALSEAFSSEVEGMWTKYEMAMVKG